MKKNGTKRNTGKTVFAALLTLTALSYLTWRIGWTVPYDHGALSVACAWILLVTEIFGAAELLGYFWLDRRGKEPEKLRLSTPGVDVFVTACGEPPELLERTLRACLAMKYAGKKQVWLLDDMPGEGMRRMAGELGVGYLTRENRENAKAGNLNAALKRTGAPLVAVFDADMAPRENFLQVTVPLMTGHVAYVQTPQHFRNRDLFQKAFSGKRAIPNEQDFFYRAIEPARNASNAVILAGSNMLLSRTALREIGGFVTGTLTEDFATGIALSKRGYLTRAVDEPLADGLAPESLGALLRQRKRWAGGCIQAGRKERILTGKGLTLRQRISYLLAVGYWYFPVKRLIYMATPLLFALGNVTVMRSDPGMAAIFWLPMFLLTGVGVILSSRGTRTVGWSMLYETVLSPFLFGTVLRTALGPGKREFEVTDKSGKRDFRLRWLLPFLLGMGLNGWGLWAAVTRSLNEGTFLYALLILWIAYHFYLELLGFLFVLASGRKGKDPLAGADEDRDGIRIFPLLENKLILFFRGIVHR